MDSLRVTPLQVLWLVLAAIGLFSVGIAAVNVDGGSFVDDVFANAATTTIALDLLVLGVAVVVWVVVEARRLGMKRPWLWAVLSVPLTGRVPGAGLPGAPRAPAQVLTTGSTWSRMSDPTP